MRPLRSFALGGCLPILLAAEAALAADPVVITAPNDGAVVSAQFSLTVSYGVVEGCDVGGCVDKPAEYVRVFANETFLAGGDVDSSGEVTYEVELEPGQYQLVAYAHWDSLGTNTSNPVHITVAEAVTTGDGTSSETGATSGAGATSTAGPANEKPDGCSCRQATELDHSLPWLGAIVLLAHRQRRLPRSPG